MARYDEIVAIHSPLAASKHTADRFSVELKDGRIVDVPIIGGDHKHRDVWTFLTFLKVSPIFNRR